MIRFAYTMLAALFLLVCVNLIPALSQEKKDEPAEDPMMKLGQPGAMHKWLAEEVGDWTIEGKVWMPGAKDAMAFKATSKMTMKFDRFLHEEFNSDDLQMKGFGIFAYDNSNEEFQGMWTNNMQTGLRLMSGKLDEKAGRLTISGEWTEKGMGGMKLKTRVVSTRKSKDEAFVEVFDTYDDKPEVKILEMTYTRKK